MHNKFMEISWLDLDQYANLAHQIKIDNASSNQYKQRYLNIDGQYYSGIVIAGPTASGKSAYASYLLDKLATLARAHHLNNAKQLTVKPVIINADSVQVYNVLPKLSAQPQDLEDHYLYNFLDIQYNYSSHQWLLDLRSLLVDNTDFFPIIVGGTGFYINALLSGIHPLPARALNTPWDHMSLEECRILVQQIDQSAAEQIKDHRRLIRFLDLYHNHNLHQFKLPAPIKLIQRNFYKIFVTSKDIHSNINNRLLSDFQATVDEVEQLQSTLPNIHDQSFTAVYANLNKIIGYTEINLYLKKELTRAQVIENICRRTYQYAKRQTTWFKKYYKPHLTICND